MKNTFISLSVVAAAVALCSMVDRTGSSAGMSQTDTTLATPAALPVMETFVSPDILTKAKSANSGDTLYDVTMAKCSDSTHGYILRTLHGGTLTASWLDSTGASMAAPTVANR